MKEIFSIERAKRDVAKIEGVITMLKAIEESKKVTPRMDMVEEIRKNLKKIHIEGSPLSRKDRQEMLKIDDFIVRALTVSEAPVTSEMMDSLIEYCGDDFDTTRVITIKGELINLISQGFIDLNLDRTFSLHKTTIN